VKLWFYDKFNTARICTRGNYAQKWIIKFVDVRFPQQWIFKLRSALWCHVVFQ